MGGGAVIAASAPDVLMAIAAVASIPLSAAALIVSIRTARTSSEARRDDLADTIGERRRAQRDRAFKLQIDLRPAGVLAAFGDSKPVMSDPSLVIRNTADVPFRQIVIGIERDPPPHAHLATIAFLDPGSEAVVDMPPAPGSPVVVWFRDPDNVEWLRRYVGADLVLERLTP